MIRKPKQKRESVPINAYDSRFSLSLDSASSKLMDLEEGLQDEIELNLIRIQELGRYFNGL